MHFKNDNNQRKNPSIEICQSLGERSDQQDRFVISQMQIGTLVVVSDGHGGHMVADIVAAQVSAIFAELLEKTMDNSPRSYTPCISNKQIKSVIKNTINDLIEKTKNEISGATLSLAFIEQGYSNDISAYQSGCRVTTGQLGDSIIAMSKKSGHLYMSNLHAVQYAKADVAEIKKRFENKYKQPCRSNGGYIRSAQNSNGIAVTRALGDKSFMLIRKPEIKSYFLPTGSITLLASDGILNKNQVPRKLVNQYMKQLHNFATANELFNSMGWFNDNTTMVVIRN